MGIMWQVYTAAMNGHVEANPHMDPNYRDDPKLCYVRDEPDDDNNSFLNKSSGGGGSKLIHKIAPCCIWIFDDGVIAWITVAAILLSWLSFLVFQLRVFVTSGTSTNTTFHLGREREREKGKEELRHVPLHGSAEWSDDTLLSLLSLLSVLWILYVQE